MRADSESLYTEKLRSATDFVNNTISVISKNAGSFKGEGMYELDQTLKAALTLMKDAYTSAIVQFTKTPKEE
jgi:hypothetical protein